MPCLSSLVWLWIFLPISSSPLDNSPPPFPHSHWAVKSWNTVIWNHCLYDSKKKKRTCTRFWSKRIIYKIDVAKNLRECFFFFSLPKASGLREITQTKKPIFKRFFFVLTEWLRFIPYNVHHYFCLPCYSAPPQKDVTYEHRTPVKMGRVRNIRITVRTLVSNNEWKMKRKL